MNVILFNVVKNKENENKKLIEIFVSRAIKKKLSECHLKWMWEI